MQFKVNKKYQCYTCEAYLRGKCLLPLYHKEILPTEDDELCDMQKKYLMSKRI